MEIPPMPDEDDFEGKIMTLKITKTRQLENVILKGPKCILRIPELNVEMMPNGLCQTPTVVELLSCIVQDFAFNVREKKLKNISDDDMCDKVMEMVQMSEVTIPFSIVLIDKTGYSRFKNMDLVDEKRL